MVLHRSVLLLAVAAGLVVGSGESDGAEAVAVRAPQRAVDAATSSEIQAPLDIRGGYRLSGFAQAVGMPRFSYPVVLGDLTPGAGGGGMVVADLDGDGDADLATGGWFSGPPTVLVLFGKGSGSFGARRAYRIARYPTAITVADVDADGDPDLVAAGRDRAGSISVLVNRGDGRFDHVGTYASGAKVTAMAAGDVNQDGTVDLVTAHDSRRQLMVQLGEGAGRFRLDPRSVALLSMLTSNRDDAFGYVGARATDVALGDLNGDGKLDAALATRSGGGQFVAPEEIRGAVVVRFGHGDGSFGDAHTHDSGAYPTDVALADVNHDGRLDIAVAEHGAGAVSVFVGNGDGTLGARRAYRMSKWNSYVDAVHIADFDRDGHLDLAASAAAGIVVRRGSGDGTFLRAQVEGVIASLVGGTVADFNGDGWPDLAFSRYDYGDAWGYVFVNWTGLPAPPCVVPDLRSRLPSAIRGTGCRRGHARRRFSRTVRRGETISQRPSAGQVLPNGSRVDIVISRGRRR
jgi:hypothetical protein